MGAGVGASVDVGAGVRPGIDTDGQGRACNTHTHTPTETTESRDAWRNFEQMLALWARARERTCAGARAYPSVHACVLSYLVKCSCKPRQLLA